MDLTAVSHRRVSWRFTRAAFHPLLRDPLGGFTPSFAGGQPVSSSAPPGRGGARSWEAAVAPTFRSASHRAPGSAGARRHCDAAGGGHGAPKPGPTPTAGTHAVGGSALL